MMRETKTLKDDKEWYKNKDWWKKPTMSLGEKAEIVAEKDI
jgi:hypothetical protein